MKSNRLALIVLPIAVLVLLWAVPYNMFMAKGTKANNKDAAAAEAQRNALRDQLAVAEDAKAREAQNTEQLKKLRKIMPAVPEEFLSPIMRSLGERAEARGVSLSVQEAAQPTVGPPPSTAAATSGAPAANADAGQPFTIRLSVAGSREGVLAFIADFPGTQRVFVDSVDLKPGDGASSFGREAAAPVKANLSLRAYVASSATLTG